MSKPIWGTICGLAGAAIGALLLGLQFQSQTWAIVGGVGGLILGVGFSRLVSLTDMMSG